MRIAQLTFVLSGYTVYDRVNERIEQSTLRALERTASAGQPAISQRLKELEREWDIERTIEANASSLALIGLALGAFVNSWFFLLPAVIAAFLLQHALQGWCPPVPILRRLKFRTQTEIEQERYALKALRGDFKALGGNSAALPDQVRVAFRAAQR